MGSGSPDDVGSQRWPTAEAGTPRTGSLGDRCGAAARERPWA
jgi:hypothetical protein